MPTFLRIPPSRTSGTEQRDNEHMATQHHRTRRRAAALVLVGLVALGATGCSDEGGDDEEVVRRTTTTEARATSSTTTTTEVPEGEPTDVEPVPVEEPAAYVNGLVAQYGADEAGALDVRQALCIAEAWVGIIGPDAFAAGGVTSTQLATRDKTLRDLPLDAATADEVVGAIETCGLELRTVAYGLLGEQFADPAIRDCVDQALPAEAIRQIVAGSVTAVAPPPDALQAAVECLPG